MLLHTQSFVLDAQPQKANKKIKKSLGGGGIVSMRKYRTPHYRNPSQGNARGHADGGQALLGKCRWIDRGR